MINNIERGKRLYHGYKGYALDGFDSSRLNGLVLFIRKYVDAYYFNNARFDNLEKISLDEVKKLTKEILSKYFNITDIEYIDVASVSNNCPILSDTDEGFYEIVNSWLSPKSPYDLDIKLVDGDNSMVGKIFKPIIYSPEVELCDNRRVYFSNIELCSMLTKISAATLGHEIAHSQQERHIGYAEDYLNKEVISIFIEKLISYELDSTGELLKCCENTRFSDLVIRFYECSKTNDKSNENYIDNLVYIKSILIANKLFDMYISERKQKNRDKYIDDIQKVFDGKITVEELIDSRNITINKCLDAMLLKRRS